MQIYCDFINMSSLMLLVVVILLQLSKHDIRFVEGSIIYDDVFKPQNPILKSDVGLLSVNIPPVFIKEKFWLHTLAIEIPCPDNVITPNLMVTSAEMNYSASALVGMTQNINIEKLSKESQGRILGPMNSFKQSYIMFLDLLKQMRSQYIEITINHSNLWGLLDKNRCSYKHYNDILEDAKSDIKNQLIRNKRDVANALDPTKHNVINIEGTGHTFIFNHGQVPLPTANPLLDNKNDVEIITSDRPNSVVQKISDSVLKDGQMFESYQRQLLQSTELKKSSCQVNSVDRIKYIRCVVEHSIDEHLCYQKYLICSDVKVRNKRGLFDFIGDMQNSLYGVATEEQLKKLHNVVDTIGNISKLNSHEIMVLRNSTISLSINIMASMSNLSQNIYNELTILTSKIQLWANNIEGNVRVLENQIQETAIISSLSTATITIHTYIQLLNDMITHLNRFQDHYTHVSNIVNHRMFSDTILSYNYLNKLWTEINKSLGSDLTLIQNNNKIEIIESNIFQIYSTNSHIVVMIRIPIILNPSSLTFWDPRRVPIMREGIAYELAIRDDVLIINKARTEWTVMTQMEYVICLNHKTKICEQSLIWTSMKKISCHLSLHIDTTNVVDPCMVHQALVDPLNIPYIVSSDSRTWLISTLHKIDDASIICLENNGLPTHKGTIEIPLIGLIQIPYQCQLNMGYKTIHSPISESGSTSLDVLSIIEDYHLPFNQALILNLTSDVPFLLNTHVPKLEHIEISTKVLFNQSLSKITEINRKIINDGRLYANNIQKLEYELKKDEANYNMSLQGIKSFFSHFSLPELIIPIPSLYNVLILLWLFYLTYTRSIQSNRFSALGAASALLPEGVVKHQSFALPIINHLNRSESMSNSSGNHTIHNFDSYLIWVPTLCLLTMIFLHFHIYHVIRHQITKISGRLGWVPINKNTVQHVGENKLMIGILLKFHTPCSHRVTRRQVVIQVATLPGRFTSWYAENIKGIAKNTITGHYNRYSNYAHFHINWNNICIKSRDFKLIDTCQELPKVLSYNVPDLQFMVKRHLPWFWWKVEAESITHISISKKTDSEKIYDYSNL